MQFFLGITIDEHLDGKVPIDNLSNKIVRNVGLLNKLKHFLPGYIMKTLYSHLSHHTYSTVLYYGQTLMSQTLENYNCYRKKLFV